jgi:hypothetical protein
MKNPSPAARTHAKLGKPAQEPPRMMRQIRDPFTWISLGLGCVMLHLTQQGHLLAVLALVGLLLWGDHERAKGKARW